MAHRNGSRIGRIVRIVIETQIGTRVGSAIGGELRAAIAVDGTGVATRTTHRPARRIGRRRRCIIVRSVRETIDGLHRVRAPSQGVPVLHQSFGGTANGPATLREVLAGPIPNGSRFLHLLLQIHPDATSSDHGITPRGITGGTDATRGEVGRSRRTDPGDDRRGFDRIYGSFE